jgi:hypothetical protein
MPDAGQHLEAIGGGDEIDGAFGRRAADGIVGIAPDIERGHAGRAERPADRAARAIPGERCFHGLLVAEHGKMLGDRGRRHAVGRQPIAQPFGVVGKNDISRIGLEKGRVMSRALRLLAVQHLQRAVEGIGMRPRQHGQRSDPVRIAVGEPPGDAAAPVVAGQMKAFVGMS